jgi:hypothetical protein
MAAGAVDAARLLGADPAGPSALEAVRTWIRAARAGGLSCELAFGLTGLERTVGALLAREGEAAVRPALALLLEALAAPLAEDGPPAAPELLLAVELAPASPEEAQAVALLAGLLRERGPAAAGLRLVGRLRERPDDPGPLLALLAAAHAGSPCALELGAGDGLWSRGTAPGAGAGQVALVNLAGLALAAGRGERKRFSSRLEGALEAALEAFHQRRRRVATWPSCPALPLFHGERDPALAPLEPEVQGDVVGLVGLHAALRWLTGEGPTENPRVGELAAEVVQEARDRLEAIAARLGLSHVRLEEAPDGDAGVRMAALDLDRFPAARELLGGSAGWDTGAAGLRAGDEPDLRLRLYIARRLGRPVWLGSSALASEPPEVAAARVLDALAQRGTGRRGRPGSGRPGEGKSG